MEHKDYDYTAFIGDIHACYDELCQMLDIIDQKYPKTRIILLGDLTDRSEKHIEVIDKCIELNLECVRGNHDDKILKWLVKKDVSSYKYQAYYSQLTDRHIQYIRSMPYYIELPDVIAVHAGIKPGLPMTRQDPHDMMYLRYTDKNRKMISLKKINQFGKEALGAVFWTEFPPFSKNIVYGHNVHDLKDIKIDTHLNGITCFGLDTGCCFGGNLNCLLIPKLSDGKHDWARKEIIQVQAKREYYKSTFSVR